MGLAGLTSISGTFFNQVYGKDMKNNTIEDDRNSIKNITKQNSHLITTFIIRLSQRKFKCILTFWRKN